MDNQTKYQIGSYHEVIMVGDKVGCIAKIMKIVAGQELADVEMLQRHTGELSYYRNLPLINLNPEPFDRAAIVNIANQHIDRLKSFSLGV